MLQPFASRTRVRTEELAATTTVTSSAHACQAFLAEGVSSSIRVSLLLVIDFYNLMMIVLRDDETECWLVHFTFTKMLKFCLNYPIIELCGFPLPSDPRQALSILWIKNSRDYVWWHQSWWHHLIQETKNSCHNGLSILLGSFYFVFVHILVI